MTLILTNAFSINMLETSSRLEFKKISLEEARSLLADGFVSAVGHEDTARVLSSLLGLEVKTNRVTITLREDEALLVAQYRGPRLPEGATQLPQGATIEWWLVKHLEEGGEN